MSPVCYVILKVSNNKEFLIGACADPEGKGEAGVRISLENHAIIGSVGETPLEWCRSIFEKSDDSEKDKKHPSLEK